MSEFNRRKFLEGSAGVAAAATLGTGAAVFAPAVHAHHQLARCQHSVVGAVRPRVLHTGGQSGPLRVLGEQHHRDHAVRRLVDLEPQLDLGMARDRQRPEVRAGLVLLVDGVLGARVGFRLSIVGAVDERDEVNDPTGTLRVALSTAPTSSPQRGRAATSSGTSAEERPSR